MGRIEIYFFSLCLVPPEIGNSSSEQSNQVNGKDWHVFLACARISIFWGPRNPLRQSLMSGLGLDFPGLENSFSLRTPSGEFYLSQFGGAYMINWPDLFCKQISFHLAVFGGDEGNFRENNIIFQWMLNSSSVHWGLYLWKFLCYPYFCPDVLDGKKII